MKQIYLGFLTLIMVLVLLFLFPAILNLVTASIVDGLVSAWTFNGNLKDSVGRNDGEFFSGSARPNENKVPSGPANPANGIISAWTFDGNTDDGVKDNDGEFKGAPPKNTPVYVEGKFGKAIEFDGIDDYIEIPDDKSLHFPEGLTVTAWINVRVSGNHAAICWKGEKIGWGANFSWRIATTTGNNMTWGRCITGSEKYFATNNVLPGMNQWVHVALTCLSPGAPTTQRAYVNGKDITNGTDQVGNLSAQPPFLIFEKKPVIIGVGRAVNGTIGNDSYFNGLIDEVGIWNRGLTPEEIEQVMKKGLPSRYAVDVYNKMVVTWGRIKKD